MKHEKILTIVFVAIAIIVNGMVKYSVTEIEYMTMHHRYKSILGIIVGLFFVSPFILIDTIKSIKNNVRNNNKFFSEKNKENFVAILALIAIFVFGIIVIVEFKHKYW